MTKRNKYDYTFRLQCVEAVLKKGQSISEVARAKGFDKNELRLWLYFYAEYGKKGLQPITQRHYEPSFKREVLATIDKEHLSLRHACARFKIPSPAVIRDWRKAYAAHSETELNLKPLTSKVRAPSIIHMKRRIPKQPFTKEQELLLEIQRLRVENELLKKLHALVQPERKHKTSWN